MKKKISLMTVLILVFVISLSPCIKTYAAGSYWITAGSKLVSSSWSPSNGELIYRGSKLQIKGKWQKGKTIDKARAGKRKNYNKTLKISKRCKVVEMEMPNDHVYTLKKWIKKNHIKKGQSIEFIQGYVKVNKKGVITKICFSA